MLTSQSARLAAAITTFPEAPNAYNMQPCDNANFLYYKITKCGSTFMQRLINQIDNLPVDAEPNKVLWDNSDCTAFVIIRNPIDRFLSLYFDKIFSHSSEMANTFREQSSINLNAKTIQDHEENCLRALAYIKKTVERKILKTMNVHWRPQIYRLHKISKLNVKMLTLDGLSWQLPELLQTQFPNIKEEMAKCGYQNKSFKPIEARLLKTPRILNQISSIYAADEAIYANVHRHWETFNGQSKNGQIIE